MDAFHRHADGGTPRRRQERGRAAERPVRSDGRRARSRDRRSLQRRTARRSGGDDDSRRPRDHRHRAVLVAVSAGARSGDAGPIGRRSEGRDRRWRVRYRAAEVHPRGGRRDHAALSAGVPDRARGRRAGCHRRQAGEEERHRPDRTVAVASSRKALARSERLHPHPLPAALAAAGSLCLSAVRRRRPGLHRRAFRAGRGDPGAGQDDRRIQGRAGRQGRR